MKKIISSLIVLLLLSNSVLADVATKNPIIQDEGTTVSGSGRILNFTGAGVAVTFAGGKYVITIAGGAGSGDITSVGDVADGAAFDGTAGTYLIFNDATGDGKLITADLTGAHTWTLPDNSGTILTTGSTYVATEVDPTVDSSAEIQAILGKADTSTNGYLWSTDWTTFNAKQAAIANYVGTVADGTGIDGTASGAGSTYTPTFDATELGGLTWSTGSGTNFTWTFDLSGTDVAINWTSAKMDVTGTVNATTLTEGGNAVYNSTEVPGGELGGTWASPTINDSVAVTSWNLTTPTITTSLTTSTPTTLSAAELDRLDGLAGIITTDTTACTDLEGVGLSIDTAVLKFAPAEVIAPTWGAGAQQVWTFDLATDYTMTWTTSLLTLSHGLTVSGTTTVGTLAGTIDAGGATSLEVPNSANPTVSVPGQVSVDTSLNSGAMIRFAGTDASYQIPGYQSKSFVILNPVATDDYALWRSPWLITVKAVHGFAVAGTNVVGHLDVCNSNGASCATIDSTDLTLTATNTDDTSFSTSGTCPAGGYIGWHNTSVGGSPTSVTTTWDFIVNTAN